MSQTQMGYCEQCEADREIRFTVAWQPNFCAVCGAEMDD